MLAADSLGLFQIGEGARHLEQAVRGAQRQRQAFAGSLQPGLILDAELAMAAQSGEVEKGIGAALTGELQLPRLGYLGGEHGTALAHLRRSVEGRRLARNGQVQVDAVEQRAGELVAIALDLVRRAAAAPVGITEVATGAGIHRRHQLETRRKTHLVAGPGDDDMPRLQWLTQDLEHLAVEFRQLVEKQHALMRQGDLPRLRTAAATDQRRAGCTVMGLPKGPLRPMLERAVTGHRMDGGDFQRLLLVQRRQETGQAAGQQRLAGAWRAGKQHDVRQYTPMPVNGAGVINMQKAYSYIRFSSPEQAKGDSYRRQREAAEAYCQANGLELVASKDYLFFDKGRSAFTGKHLDDTGELARFLSYVENGAVAPGSYLIVESLDRLSRERVKDALPRFLDLLNKGINVYTSADGKLYTSDYNELDLIISIVHMSRAHSESHLKGVRVSKAWRQKQTDAREKGTPLGAACPYWIEYKDGNYELIPERVRTIEQIFELAQSGFGQRAIAKTLNERGIPIFGSLKRNRNGKWGSSSCGKILSNRALLGEYQPTGLVGGHRVAIGEPVKGFFPQAISESDFYSAQAARLTRNVTKATKQTKNFNVWQGVAKCGLCGESMHLVNKGRPPKGAKYLRCYGAAKGVCNNRQVRLDRSEEVLREILAKVDSLSLVQDSQAKNQKEISVLDGKIAEVSARQKELQEQVLSLGGKLPPLLVQAMVMLDDSLASYNERREELLSNIKRERIISKEDFFRKLDLISYQGRARANSLLKNLEVVVKIARRDSDVDYMVASREGSLFNILHAEGADVVYYPQTKSILDLSIAQGDLNDLQVMFSEITVGGLDNNKKIRELLESRERYSELTGEDPALCDKAFKV